MNGNVHEFTNSYSYNQSLMKQGRVVLNKGLPGSGCVGQGGFIYEIVGEILHETFTNTFVAHIVEEHGESRIWK